MNFDIHCAQHEGVPWWQLAQRNERSFSRAYELVVCRPPTVEPRVDASAGADLRRAVDSLVVVALEQREAARARKDFATADTIRGQLAAAGVNLQDTPAGPRWSMH